MKTRVILIIVGSLAAFGFARAQHRQVLLGDSLYAHYSYAKAAGHYEKALKKVDNPLDVQVKLGDCYYKLQDLSRSLEYYNMAIGNSGQWSEESRWNFLNAQRAAGNDALVKRYLAEWASLNKMLAGSVSTGLLAEDLYYIDSAAFEVELAGVNTDRSEFAPAYFKQGLVFASSRKEGNYSGKKYHWDGGYYLDLYYSPIQTGSSAKPEVSPFGENTVFHDGPVVFLDHDTKVIFTRNESGKSRDGKRMLMLVQADVMPTGAWVNAKPLSVNSPDYSVSHPAVSADGDRLYFVSDMPGGEGGTDIWYADRNGEEWGTPVNLGAGINTPGDEMFPFIYRNEFFFASDGHPGLGGLDVFIAEPVGGGDYLIRNAGYPLNTARDDFGLITRNGREGYFSSNRGGQDDIYSFVRNKTLVDLFYVDVMENPLDSVETLADGKRIVPVADRTHMALPMNTVTGINASHKNYQDTLFTITTGEEFYLARTIPLNELTLRGMIDIYPIAAEREVDFYLGLPEKLLIADDNGNWQKDIDVVQVEEISGINSLEVIRKVLDQNGYEVLVKDTITAVFFDFDKYYIRDKEKSNLQRLIALLERYPEAKVVVSAHTDARGSDAYNDKLAERRALSTRDYLIANGISSERILTRSYGERQLWIDCEKCTEDEHQLNRRAVFGVDKE